MIRAVAGARTGGPWAARLVLPLLMMVVLAPSARLHWFDGLPLSTMPEFIALLVLFPVIVSRGLRRLSVRALRRSGPGALAIVVALLLALAGKALLWQVDGRTGFLACYATTIEELAGVSPCERSYENPWFRHAVTRIDRAIDFRPGTWNLTFFNSLRFNFYPWEAGNRVRDRLPFAAHWRGAIDLPAASQLELAYVGEGQVRVGDATVVLPPSYARQELVIVPVSSGSQPIELRYRFDDGLRIGDGRPRGSYARVRVAVRPAAASTQAFVPLDAAGPSWSWRALGIFIDVVVVIALASLAWSYVVLLARERWTLAAVAVGGLLLRVDPTAASRVWWDGQPLAETGVPGGVGFPLFVCALVMRLLLPHRRPARWTLVAYVAIGWFSLCRKEFLIRGFQTVLHASAGGDWMTYASFARSILETGSLEAGEPVFYYQPLFRYLKFGLHLLLGDGDTLPALFAHGALIVGLYWMAATLWPRRADIRAVEQRQARVEARWPVALAAAATLLLLLLATSESVSRLIYVGASEPATWIMFPPLFAALFGSRAPRRWRGGVVWLALSLITRMNHALALGWMFALFLLRTVRTRPGIALRAVLIVSSIAILPTVHNLYYGGRLSVLPEEHAVTRTLPLPPSAWLRVREDPAIAQAAWRQIGALTYSTRVSVGLPWVPTDVVHRLLLITCRGLQIVWLGASVLLLFTPGLAWTTRLLVVTPLLYLAPHLFYQVLDYHPRFIVSGYLAMGAVTLFAAGQIARARGGRRLPRSRDT